MAVNFAQRFWSNAELQVTVATVTLFGRRQEQLRQSDVALHPVIKRRVRPFAVAFVLRLAQNMERGAALEHARDARASIVFPGDGVDALAQIAFVMSVAPAERSQLGGQQFRGPAILRERTFGVEQFKA